MKSPLVSRPTPILTVVVSGPVRVTPLAVFKYILLGAVVPSSLKYVLPPITIFPSILSSLAQIPPPCGWFEDGPAALLPLT